MNIYTYIHSMCICVSLIYNTYIYTYRERDIDTYPCAPTRSS